MERARRTDFWGFAMERLLPAWQHCPKRVHAGAGQALEAILISTLFGFKNQHSEVVGSADSSPKYINRGYALRDKPAKFRLKDLRIMRSF